MLNTYGISDEDVRSLLRQGISPSDPVPFYKLRRASVGVKIVAALPDDAQVEPLNWTINIATQRGAVVSFSDWAIEQNEAGQKVLSFIAHMPVPSSIAPEVPTEDLCPDYVCSFNDFCWYQGHEDIQFKHRPETMTQLDKDDNYADIGWVLPGRFADRLIDALGKLNDFIVSGVLEDSLIYGPMYVNRGKQ